MKALSDLLLTWLLCLWGAFLDLPIHRRRRIRIWESPSLAHLHLAWPTCSQLAASLQPTVPMLAGGRHIRQCVSRDASRARPFQAALVVIPALGL